MFLSTIIALSLSLNLSKAALPESDPYIWLEEATSAKALDWANNRNQETFARLKKSSLFQEIQTDVRKILLASDKLPVVSLSDGLLYNFWQDSSHVRGIWRRTTSVEFQKQEPNWETILDLDELAKNEGENWVWGGANCYPHSAKLCLLKLSRGGKDAAVYREFNTNSKSFVKNGFTVPENKSTVAWIDANTIYVSSDFGAGTVSTSGYPISTRVWKRGTPLSGAREVFRGEVNDVSAESFTDFDFKKTYHFTSRATSFFEAKMQYQNEKGKRFDIPLPQSANFQTTFQGFALFSLRAELKTPRGMIPQGSLIALPLSKLKKGAKALENIELVFTPSQTRFFQSVAKTRDFLVIDVLDNVRGQSIVVNRTIGGHWKVRELSATRNGVATVAAAELTSNTLILYYTDFLTPESYYVGSAKPKSGTPKLLKQVPARFESSDLVSEQFYATSKDGTKVPYFIVHKKSIAFDGKNPTVVYGYGGFENSLTPYYLAATGKIWLEKGGVYVLSNIRGGGEFGPAWHEAALKENRQRAFDDFIAISEDVIQRKITGPKHLAIWGGSNGGLLTGAVFVQRPDLYNAVLCEVPLLDMIRFPLLGAGTSWEGEYGDPNDPAMREIILKYSPYQNVQKDKTYPEAFFLSSTADDRVTPAHARKMVARMMEQGHPVLYYENTEGGHAGSANIEQKVLWKSLGFSYLWEKLK